MIGSWLQQGGLDTSQWWFCSALVWPNSIQCPCLPGSSLVFQFELCAGFWRLPCPVHRSVRNAAFTSQMVLDDECWMATTWHFSPKLPGASPFLSKCRGFYQSNFFLPLDCMLMIFYRFSMVFVICSWRPCSISCLLPQKSKGFMNVGHLLWLNGWAFGLVHLQVRSSQRTTLHNFWHIWRVMKEAGAFSSSQHASSLPREIHRNPLAATTCF